MSGREGNRNRDCSGTIMGMPGKREPADKEDLHLRIQPALKRQVEDYADRAGISVNAAATLLLAAALRAERRREQ